MANNVNNVDVEDFRNEMDAETIRLQHLKIDSTPSSNDTPSGNNATTDFPKPELVIQIFPPIGNNGSTTGSHLPNHQLDPEPESTATQGNNLLFPDTESEVDHDESNTTIPDFDFIMNDPEVKPEEEDQLNQLDKERKELLDANNVGDLSIPRPKESIAYRLLPTKAPGVTELHNLKCCEVRWFYEKETQGLLSKKKKLVPFRGHDSLRIEIKYRRANGEELDPEAQEFFKKNMLHYDLPQITSTNKLSSGNKMFVQQGYYSINKDNTAMIAEYWNKDVVPICRRTYFTVNEKPVEPKIAAEIEKHLHRKGSTESAEFLIEKIRVICHATNEITIQKPNESPQNLVVYPKKASFHDGNAEIQHLVFVVHGVGHNKKPESIVNAVKRLIEGVQSQNNSDIMFFPIHWRSLIEDHTCIAECAREQLNIGVDSILRDVKLYNCTEMGAKIRQFVISQIKSLYDTFKTNNPDFSGSVALFGHSLGSVICYDILTNFKDIQSTSDYKLHFEVARLFTIGSPLKIFLDHRECIHQLFSKDVGPTPIEKFREIHHTRPFRIFNVYHPYDPVARRLDPLIDAKYKGYLAIKVQKARGSSFKKYIRKKARSIRCMRPPSTDSEDGLPPQIDHEIYSTYKWRGGAHTCYWKHQDVHRFIPIAFNNFVKPRKSCTSFQATTTTPTGNNEVEVEILVEDKLTTGNNEIGNNEDIVIKPKDTVITEVPEPPPVTVSA